MSASDGTAGMLDEMIIWYNPRLREAMVLTGESDGRPGAPPAGSNEGAKFCHNYFMLCYTLLFNEFDIWFKCWVCL